MFSAFYTTDLAYSHIILMIYKKFTASLTEIIFINFLKLFSSREQLSNLKKLTNELKIRALDSLNFTLFNRGKNGFC